MIITDFQYRLIQNLQSVGNGNLKHNTFSKVTTFTSADSTGFTGCIVLPKQDYGVTITVSGSVKVTGGATGLIRADVHNSPYYGATFTTIDSHTASNTDWAAFRVRLSISPRSGNLYPRMVFGADSGGAAGTVEFRGVEIVSDGGSIREGGDNRLLRQESLYGPDFAAQQNVTPVTSGTGVITFDPSFSNYTEFTGDQAYYEIERFTGFSVNNNVEYYVVESDARLEVQAGQGASNFVFLNSGGTDTKVPLLLCQTEDNSGDACYVTHRWIIVQDGFPRTKTGIRLSVGTFIENNADQRIRETRIRSHGLTTGTLKDKGLNFCAAVQVNSSAWSFDEDYRRESISNVRTSGANTIDFDLSYQSGKYPCISFSAIDSTIRPVISLLSNTLLKVNFYDAAGSIVPLASIPDGFKFIINGVS